MIRHTSRFIARTVTIALLGVGLTAIPLASGGSDIAVASGSIFTLEPNTDRSGNDMRVLTMARDADAAMCEQACAETKGCVAYTFVKASTTVPSPICRLKDAKPHGHESSCCTSGALKK